ncbi:hypothetical protein SLEP1_g56265 [Rubroshorea leprosula]|uniref:Uncharacterized protein n=1 Tax=Rubroshorea leprosula TaxID=152421 RepID=A0AAV5MHZ6_9ROSI|nr:hypothetical protein SLEP1_g56265 [Rubroshorea leprosula]
MAKRKLAALHEGLFYSIQKSIFMPMNNCWVFLAHPTDAHALSSPILDCRDLLRRIPHGEVVRVVRQMARMGHALSQDFAVFPFCPTSKKVLYFGSNGVTWMCFYGLDWVWTQSMIP